MTTNKHKQSTSLSKNEKDIEIQFSKLLTRTCDQVANQILPIIKQILHNKTNDSGAKPKTRGLPVSASTSFPDSSKQPLFSSDIEERLRAVISVAAGMGFSNIIATLFHDEQLREYMLQRTSRLVGKQGGRPPKRRPHILWLEQRLIYQIRRGMRDATAAEHFEELLHADEIDDEYDGKLYFKASWLEENGWSNDQEEPFVSLNSVRDALTRIRKLL